MMKKLITIYVLFLTFAYSAGISQPKTITIGIGQFSHTTFGPMRSQSTDNVYNRHAYIYSSSLLTGLDHGDTITSLEFYRQANGNNALIGTANFKIYINNTVLNDYGPDPLYWLAQSVAATRVFEGNPAPYVGTANGFKKFPLNPVYIFDTARGKNLEILVQYTQTTGQTSSISWAYDNNTGVPEYTTGQTKYIISTGKPEPFTNSTNLQHPRIRINIGDSIVTSIDPASEIPDDYYLGQNYPNPFNPETKIEYAIPENGFVSIKVFDTLGREILSPVNELNKAGRYSIILSTKNLPAGLYFYKLSANEFTDVKKMMLLK